MSNKELLSKLISFESTYENVDQRKSCLDFIKDYLSTNKNLIFKEFEYNNEYSLLVSNTDSSEYDVLFTGHVDVVPGEKEQFTSVEKDGKIYGRGSFDMKGHDAVIINIFKNINTNNKVAAIFTSDEERGGFNGIPYIFSDYDIKASLAIVPDGGNNFDLVTEEKGVLQLEVIANGITAHSSKLYEGVNAISSVYNVYDKLIEKFPLPKDSTEFKTSINLGIINGGTTVNVVPNKASMQLDIRYSSETNKEEIIDFITSLGSNIDVNVLAEGEPYIVDLDNEYVKKYIECVENNIDRKVNFQKCESASDARFFRRYNIPSVIMNACGYNMHGPEEYIDIESLDTLQKIYEDYIDSCN